MIRSDLSVCQEAGLKWSQDVYLSTVVTLCVTAKLCIWNHCLLTTPALSHKVRYLALAFSAWKE